MMMAESSLSAGTRAHTSRQTLVIIAWMFAIACGPLAAALGRVWIRQQNVSLGYQLHQAEQHGEALRMELQRLEVARARGRTPQRVAAMALKLGLVPAQAQQVLPLRVRVVRTPETARKPGRATD